MKKILLSFLIMAVMGITAKVQAQNCSIANVVITVNSATVNGGNLDVDFNASFDLDANGGNKYLFIQSWKTAQWPNYWQCANGIATLNPKKGPKAADLVNSFLRLAINNDVTAPTQPSFTVYGFDGSVIMSTAGSVTKVYNAVTVGGITYDRFTLTNVLVTIPGITDVNDAIAVTTDVFSTNGQVTGPNSPIHCVNCGNVQFFNDPVITGFIPCSNPRKVNFGIQTSAIPAGSIFTYKIYKSNGDLVLDGLDVDVTIGAPTLTTDGTGAAGGSFDYVGNNVAGTGLNDFWVVVTKVGSSQGVAKLIKPIPGTACFTLPVSFKSFTATRNRSNVLVKWETASEQNNSGFAVERNINGVWEQVGFVPSQATGGTSFSDLSYQFIDLNNTKGITQYRLKQIDIDSKSKYSEIRSVRGDGQAGKTIVYPNPSSDGKVNIVFEDATVSRDISVTDMSGRTIKQLKGITSNNITIDNLTPGMYSLRIVVPSTGDQSVEKIVVNKR